MVRSHCFEIDIESFQVNIYTQSFRIQPDEREIERSELTIRGRKSKDKETLKNI